MSTAPYVRIAASVSLVLTAALSVVAIALQPALAETTAGTFAVLEAAGPMALISAGAFVVAQLFFIIAMLGVAHLAGGRAPIVSSIGGTLAVIGGFGHAVFGGVQLLQLAMANDTANHSVYAALIESGLPAPLLILMLAGTIGTVLGLLLLGVGLLRSKAAPVWVPFALWAFILVEFVGTNFTAWASLVSGLLYVGALGALAVTIWRSPRAVWTSASVVESTSRPAVGAAV